jgi:colanic acid/amylovoran biosynthesis glycosyltransferase
MATRIAYFTNVYPAVSHAFIRREILAVERQGFDVLRVALRGWDSRTYDDQDAIEQSNTRYVLKGGVLPLLGSVLSALFASPKRFFSALALAFRQSRRSVRALPYHLVYFAEACRLAAWLREHGAEHIHAHFGTNSAEIVMLARELGGPPYSYTVHGPVEFDNIDYFGTADKIARSAFIVAITDFTRSQLCRTVAYRHWEKILVVRCGLDPDFYVREPDPVPLVARLTCIGRIVEQKGQQVLVEAAALLRDRGRDFILSIVGDGPMAEDVRRLVKQYGLEDRIQMPGVVTTSELLDELRRSRGLVLPSFAEGLPMVIMESMALGRPVVSTYVAGIPELVVPGENGWLVPASAAGPLADAMEELLNLDAPALQRMASAAFTRVKALHAADDLAAKLGALFRQSIAEGQGRLAGAAAKGAA